MPSRNIVKQYSSDSYYHVYGRGVAKQALFLDAQDYGYFIGLFKRYLSANPSISPARVEYPHYGNRIDLLAYCLMPNHFHILLYQRDAEAMRDLMRSIMTSYSMYFNKRYVRRGPVFESRYKASIIDKENYLEHISRYIHLNPKMWQKYRYSSINYYVGGSTAEWLKPDEIISMFDSKKGYLTFLKDYEDHKKMLDELKWELANE